MSIAVYDDRPCELGEGPIRHPGRAQMFWFDILNRKMLTREGGSPAEYAFSEIASAAGWTGPDSLLIASETGLSDFNLVTCEETRVADIEQDDPNTRSNDGRADPQGGFWMSTMSKTAEQHKGAIYRYYRGETRQLVRNITIPNSICFTPDGNSAYFTDSADKRVLRIKLDAQGWPSGLPEVFLDFRGEDFAPDGSVTDRDGNLWNAQWGAGRVAAYSPDGALLHEVEFPARHTSCPAFGGHDLSRLYCTSAREHLSPDIIAAEPQNGQTFAVSLGVQGWPEPQVIL